ANVVQPKEPSLEDVHPLRVLAVHPPGEVEHQLVKDALQKRPISLSLALLVDLVNTPGCPCMDWGIHISKRPLISWNLAVRMHVPFAQHQRELFLRKVRINKRQRYAMKGQVPSRVPGILPLVRH